MDDNTNEGRGRVTTKVLAGISAVMIGLYGFMGTAHAAAVPPSETEFAGDVLAGFGGRLISVVTTLATNTWVLALFGFGIAAAVVRRVLSKGTSKATKVVG